MGSLFDNLRATRDRLNRACVQAGRDCAEVTLELAVKTRSADVCAQAARALEELGLSVRLGHNRVQESRDTYPAIKQAVPGAQVYLIGPLQSNKVNQALRCFDGIETVADLELAKRLSQRLCRDNRTWPTLIQVNVSDEETKSGCQPDVACDLASQVAELPGLEVRGFMTVGLPGTDESEVRAGYARLREIGEKTRHRHGLNCATELSMGMSTDLEWAIAEGATVVRVGSAIFGPRTH